MDARRPRVRCANSGLIPGPCRLTRSRLLTESTSTLNGPEPYYQDDWTTIYNAALRDVPSAPNSVDAIVTDPPFFMPADHFQSRVKWQRSWGDVSVLGTFWASTLDALMPSLKETGHFLAFCN